MSDQVGISINFAFDWLRWLCKFFQTNHIIFGLFQHKEQATVEEQVSERNAESEGDSEYEDAEDGIDQAQASGGSHTQVSSNADCRICGESIATKLCQECKDTFCVPCDGLYHKHASRQHHVRTQLPTDTGTPSTDRPASSAAATAAPSSPVPQNQRTALSNTATNATNGIRYGESSFCCVSVIDNTENIH